MADEPPLLKVSVDGRHLSWLDKYLAVFTQFFYWRQEDGFYFDDVALYPTREETAVESGKVRRPIASPYLYFYIYLFLKKDTSPFLAAATALSDIKSISLKGPEGAPQGSLGREPGGLFHRALRGFQFPRSCCAAGPGRVQAADHLC